MPSSGAVRRGRAARGAGPVVAERKSYITRAGFEKLRAELDFLWKEERPRVTQAVSVAAALGDRSENADYIYGKKRLREVDRRIRFLVRRLDQAQVVDPAQRAGAEDDDRVYFGATVDVVGASGGQRTVSIVGVDEIDTARGYISWVSPMARALIKAREGDTVTLQTPAGTEELEIAAVRYVTLATGRWTDGRRG